MGVLVEQICEKKIDSKNRLYPHSEDELERMLELFKENVEQYGDFWSVIFARSVEYIFSSEIRLADIS